MVKSLITQEIVQIPDNVDLQINDNQVVVKGALGEIRRDFSHAPINLVVEKSQLIIEKLWPDKKDVAIVGTIRSHIENMITGVLKGFTVKLKIVFAHFPPSVKTQEDMVIIENFSGERRARRAKIHGNVKIRIDGDDIIIQGIDIEHVTQTAANIENATRIKKKDSRVFLDGIYVFEKSEGV